jgi:arylsulfatase A-like enzyme
VTDRPNVVIIMTDQQKATSLPMYGNPVVETFNLKRLAQEGALFTQAHATCPLCVPARVSLMTGRYPHTTGSRTNSFLMQPHERHLMELFGERGYRTGLVGKNHCFQDGELGRLDYVWEAGHLGPVDPPTKEAAEAIDWLRSTQVTRQAWGAVRNPHPASALGTTLITDHAIDRLEAWHGEPFFLWYSIADPHTPLHAPSPYADMYHPAAMPLPPRLEGEMATKPTPQQIDYRALAGGTATPEHIRQALAIYYGMSSYIDAEVGRFMGALETLGLRKNTLVIYLSDHGDYMGEHGMIRKSKALYDCLTHVPFIASWPGVIPAGVTRGEFVIHEDVLPTLMDLLGWETPPGVQGQSMAPLLTGEDGYHPRLAVFGEHGIEGAPYRLDEVHRFPRGPLTEDFAPTLKLGSRGRCKSVRTKQWKLVHYPGQPYGELYHLETDPWELTNLYNQEPYRPVQQELAGMLLDWLIEAEDCLPASGTNMGV